MTGLRILLMFLAGCFAVAAADGVPVQAGNTIPLLLAGDAIPEAPEFVSWQAVNVTRSGETAAAARLRLSALDAEPRAVVIRAAASADTVAEVRTLLAEIAERWPQCRVLLLGAPGADMAALNRELEGLADGKLVSFFDPSSALAAGFDDAMLLENILPPIRRLMEAVERECPILPEAAAPHWIVLPADAPAPERHAAEELRYFYSRITGMTPRIGAEAPPAGTPAIYMGRGAGVRAMLPEVDFDGLLPDEVILQPQGGDLVLTGAAPSGTLYAVYTLLEQFNGVRFLASDAIEVPQRAALAMPEAAFRDAPRFASRTAMYYNLVTHDPLLAIRLRNNGGFLAHMSDWGVTERYLSGIHTFNYFLPAERYLASHPEFFSWRGGERVGGQLNGQLCLTHDGAREELTRNALAALREHPEATIISISQNDNNLPCQCENCLASDARYGAPSGTLLHFVNQVAEAIAAEFPHVTVETFAYIYTAEAPRGIVPRDNVTVRLCSFNCNFSRPLDSDGNRAFQRQLREWSRIAPRLIIWNYVANFANTMIPYPNFNNLAADLRTFAANPVQGVLEQGAWNNGMGSELQPLKVWLVSQLLWNPERDAAALTAEFLEAYYGTAAAALMAEYIALLEEEVARQEFFMGCFSSTRSWLRSETLLRAYELMQRAEAAASTVEPPAVVERVKLAALASKLALLERAESLKRNFGERVPPLEPILAEALAVARRHEPRNYGESTGFGQYADELTRQVAAAARLTPRPVATPPAVAASLGDGKYFDLTDDLLGGENCADAAASDGRATRVPGTRYDWSIQYQRNLDVFAMEPGRYRVVVVARAEGPGDGGQALEAGSYHLDTKRTDSKTFPLRELRGTDYREVDLGVHELDPQSYIFVAPVKNADMSWLYIDRIVVIPE